MQAYRAAQELCSEGAPFTREPPTRPITRDRSREARLEYVPEQGSEPQRFVGWRVIAQPACLADGIVEIFPLRAAELADGADIRQVKVGFEDREVLSHRQERAQRYIMYEDARHARANLRASSQGGEGDLDPEDMSL